MQLCKSLVRHPLKYCVKLWLSTNIKYEFRGKQVKKKLIRMITKMGNLMSREEKSWACLAPPKKLRLRGNMITCYNYVQGVNAKENN